MTRVNQRRFKNNVFKTNLCFDDLRQIKKGLLKNKFWNFDNPIIIRLSYFNGRQFSVTVRTPYCLEFKSNMMI